MDLFEVTKRMRSLSDAAAFNNIDLLQQSLNGKFGEISQSDLDHALIRGAINGNAECVTHLLDKGANIDYGDADGDTALMVSAANNFKEVVEVLLSRGCDIDDTSDRGRTAIHMAVWNNHLEIVRMLIAEKCDLNIKDMYGDTPLLLCASKGFTEVMKELIHNGSKLHVTNDEGDSALHAAAKQGRVSCLHMLLKAKLDIHKENMWEKTPLIAAVEYSNENCGIALIRAGSNINARSSCVSYKTVLHAAAERGMLKCVKTLLRYDVDVDVCDVDGNMPLMSAILKKQTAVVQTLLQHGCRTDFIGRSIFGGVYTFCGPLEAAVHLGLEKISQMLYASGDSLDFMHCYDYCYIIRSHGNLSEWMEEVKSQPRSLTDTCRIQIRKLIGPQLLTKAKLLPIPKQLQLFVAFYDLGLLNQEE